MAGTIELSRYMLIGLSVGSPINYSILGNQQNGGLSMSAARIDAANKTSVGWATAIAGLRQFQISVDGQASPDDPVLTSVVAAAIAGTRVDVNATLYSNNHGYSARCDVTQLEINGPSQQFTGYRMQFELATGTPTASVSPG